jgi:gamma-glutamyltranspeptidase/glutathione hydrolase
MYGWSWRVLLSCMLVGCLAIKGPAQDRITGQPFATRSEVIAQHAMAATSQPLATQVALDIMKQGGNAIDAAIAANATLGLMEPTGNGIGGDLFAIVWIQADQKLHGLNASGRSPESLTIERLQEELNKAGRQSIPPTGPLPVSVPGCVDGWFELHRRFGKLPMPQVLAPAIRYAREGFPVSELIAYYWRRSEGLARFPGFAETFLPGGKAPSKGDIFRNPMLAATLQQIADEGRDAFYQGSIAQRIDRFMKQHGGYLSLDDLKKHRSEWVEPVGLDYRGYRVWELPPNSQGLAALQILGMLERFPIAKAGFGSTDHLHWFIEAKKLAFEDRARYYADPEFSKVPIEGLVDREYLNERSRLIGNRSALRYDAGNPALKQGDTIYLTTADPDRNMVSLIQSNYRGFGSGMCPDQLGFCLQDRGELFDPTPGRANSYQPGKRPFHTIIPGFITKDGKPFLSFGVMGGATQPQGHAQIVLNMIDFGMNCQEAGDAPRVVHEGSSEPTGERMEDGGRVSLESGFAAQTIRDLMARGHTLGYDLGNFGGYQAIQYDAQRDIYLGASESRKDGQAAGY